MTALITLKNITKTYHDGTTEITVLAGVDLTINSGDFVGITGPSGSGKTTFLNIIGLVDGFNTGQYYYQAEEVSAASEKVKAAIRGNKFGFVLQNFGLISDLTVKENILLPSKYAKKTKQAIRESFASLVNSLEIADLVKKNPNKISGGQKQRVAIARALINNPDLILADEPTGNLDHENSQRVLEILKAENDQGRTIVMVTHDPQMLQYCNRILQIDEGQVTNISSN